MLAKGGRGYIRREEVPLPPNVKGLKRVKLQHHQPHHALVLVSSYYTYTKLLWGGGGGECLSAQVTTGVEKILCGDYVLCI